MIITVDYLTGTVIKHGIKEFTLKSKEKTGSKYDNLMGECFQVIDVPFKNEDETESIKKYLIIMCATRAIKIDITNTGIITPVNLEQGVYKVHKISGKACFEVIVDRLDNGNFPSILSLFTQDNGENRLLGSDRNIFIKDFYCFDCVPFVNIDFLLGIYDLLKDTSLFTGQIYCRYKGVNAPIIFEKEVISYLLMPLRY